MTDEPPASAPTTTRGQSQARTRERLIEAARTLFAAEGYGQVSVERIARAAGFTKGAFYSNFASKQDIFLAVLAAHGRQSLDRLLAALDRADGPAAAIEEVAAWADRIAGQAIWPFLVLDHARHAMRDGTFGPEQERLFRDHWQKLGRRLLAFLSPGAPAASPETLGALVFELTYAPAMSFVTSPSASTLIRLALAGLFRPDERTASRASASSG